METNGVFVVNQSSPVVNRRGSMPNTSNYAAMSPKSPMDFTSMLNLLRLKTPLPPAKCERNQSIEVVHSGSPFERLVGKQGRMTVNQSVSSFAIVFVLNEAAPPCVLSHYTELARLVCFGFLFSLETYKMDHLARYRNCDCPFCLGNIHSYLILRV